MRVVRIINFSIGLLILGVLVGYLCTFQLDFNETALVTTFGRATETSVKNSSGDEAGLHLRWPWPIQDVIRFDRRMLLLQDRLEQQETRDKQVVILKSYVVWRIKDPLSFYRSFSTMERANIFLRDRLRSAKAVIGNFSFDELTNSDPEKLRLDEARDALRTRIQKDIANQQSGISIQTIGINRIILPESITKSVFSRMEQTRQRLAQNARSEGNAIARSIKAQAESDRQRILSFTDRIAQDIRAQGDSIAAGYYREYAKSKELALFLRKLDALEKSLSNNTTFIVDTDNEPFDLLD